MTMTQEFLEFFSPNVVSVLIQELFFFLSLFIFLPMPTRKASLEHRGTFSPPPQLHIRLSSHT